MTLSCSANERKRRQVYRGEVHGQLPFDTRGMDDPVPTIDFSPYGGKDSAYSLEREDVDGEPDHVRRVARKKDRNPFWTAFLQVVHDLEGYARENSDPAVLSSVQEARFVLEKLVQKMDNLEAGFDRIAERSRTFPFVLLLVVFLMWIFAVLSASRLSASRRKRMSYFF